MKPLSTLSKFLQEHDIDNISSKELVSLKKQYWKLYQKKYYQERKQTQKRLTIRLTPQEYNRLFFYKKEHKLSLNNFIVQAAIAYVEHYYIPRNKDVQREQVLAIKKIGNNVNQIVHKIHRLAFEISPLEKPFINHLQKQYTALTYKVQELEACIKVDTPPKLADVLFDTISKDFTSINSIRNWLDEFEKQLIQDADN